MPIANGQDDDVTFGSGEDVERTEQRVGVAQRRQLVRRVPDQVVERGEVVTECRLDEPRQSAAGLASFANLVDRRLEVDVVGRVERSVEKVDRVVEPFGRDASYLPAQSSPRIEHVPHDLKSTVTPCRVQRDAT